MGTNFYARINPTRTRKRKIKKAIDEDDYDKIHHLINATYKKVFIDYDSEPLTVKGGIVHLGKRSGGWKFLWNPNWYRLPLMHTEKIKTGENSYRYIPVDDGFNVFKFYELNRESIKNFINRKNVTIYDEYGEIQNKEEFFDMAVNWGYDPDKPGWDSESYEQYEINRQTDAMNYYQPYILRSEYIDFLGRECGFKLTKYNADFYSDGLRFATSLEFS